MESAIQAHSVSAGRQAEQTPHRVLCRSSRKGTAMTNVETTQDAPIAVQLKQKESQFQAALPPQVSVSKFIRVVLTAVQNNPRLEQTERRSFWNACMKAAADGLLPDNREAAFVIFRQKEG